jgi:hypothetical protein
LKFSHSILKQISSALSANWLSWFPELSGKHGSQQGTKSRAKWQSGKTTALRVDPLLNCLQTFPVIGRHKEDIKTLTNSHEIHNLIILIILHVPALPEKYVKFALWPTFRGQKGHLNFDLL